MTGYMVIPLGLTDEQEHIYIKMYKRCDFKTMTVKYTLDQLVMDSNKCFNLTKKKVRNIIETLKDEGYIKEVKKGTKGNPAVFQIIKINEIGARIGHEKGTNRAQIMAQPCDLQEIKGTNRAQMGHELGTPIKEKEKEKDIYSEIIEFLNQKAGKKFRATTKANIDIIDKRLKDGFTLEEFKTVIENKCESWLDSEYEKYLRPATLFGDNMDSYLNEKKKANKVINFDDFIGI